MRWSRAPGAHGALPLMPRLQLLWDNLPWQQPDGVARVLLQRGRSNQSGVRRRRLQDSSWRQSPFQQLSLWKVACHRKGRQEALFHVLVFRGEGAVFHYGPVVAKAGLRLAGGLVWGAEVGDAFLLCAKVESIRWWAQRWDLSGSIPARRAIWRGRVFRASVLRAGLVRTKGRVLYRMHHDVGHTGPLGQPAMTSTADWAEVIFLNRWLTFRKSVEIYQIRLQQTCSL